MGDGLGQGTAEDERRASEPGATSTGTPRWVKVSAAIAVAVVLLIVVMLVFGGGGHGPGRHLGGGDSAAGHEPPSWVPEH